jgi:hypothetical protein
MKKFTGHVPFDWPQTTRDKGLQLALVLGVVMLVAGCGKKESPKPATATPPTPPSAAPVTPMPPPVNPGAAASADADLTVLQQLNRAVINFRMQKNRNPSSVEEVASAAGIQLPAPPPGKKYAFNGRGMVVLVDNSTK